MNHRPCLDCVVHYCILARVFVCTVYNYEKPKTNNKKVAEIIIHSKAIIIIYNSNIIIVMNLKLHYHFASSSSYLLLSSFLPSFLVWHLVDYIVSDALPRSNFGRTLFRPNIHLTPWGRGDATSRTHPFPPRTDLPPGTAKNPWPLANERVEHPRGAGKSTEPWAKHQHPKQQTAYP